MGVFCTCIVLAALKSHLVSGGAFLVTFTGGIVGLDCVLCAQGNTTGLKHFGWKQRKPLHLFSISSLPGSIGVIYI